MSDPASIQAYVDAAGGVPDAPGLTAFGQAWDYVDIFFTTGAQEFVTRVFDSWGNLVTLNTGNWGYNSVGTGAGLAPSAPR